MKHGDQGRVSEITREAEFLAPRPASADQTAFRPLQCGERCSRIITIRVVDHEAGAGCQTAQGKVVEAEAAEEPHDHEGSRSATEDKATPGDDGWWGRGSGADDEPTMTGTAPMIQEQGEGVRRGSRRDGGWCVVQNVSAAPAGTERCSRGSSF